MTKEEIAEEEEYLVGILTASTQTCKEATVLRCLRVLGELEAAQDLVFELFNQACNLWRMGDQRPRYDTFCESTYEDAQAYLINIGRVKPEECVRI